MMNLLTEIDGSSWLLETAADMLPWANDCGTEACCDARANMFLFLKGANTAFNGFGGISSNGCGRTLRKYGNVDGEMQLLGIAFKIHLERKVFARTHELLRVVLWFCQNSIVEVKPVWHSKPMLALESLSGANTFQSTLSKAWTLVFRLRKLELLEPWNRKPWNRGMWNRGTVKPWKRRQTRKVFQWLKATAHKCSVSRRNFLLSRSLGSGPSDIPTAVGWFRPTAAAQVDHTAGAQRSSPDGRDLQPRFGVAAFR